MVATLVVTLSLAASTPPRTVRAAGTPAAAPAMEVPFLPQTEALCGGAAAAMVYRFWGDAHADVQQFAPLVDRRAGGIRDTDLVDAIRRGGWNIAQTSGSFERLQAALGAGQPPIVLIED